VKPTVYQGMYNALTRAVEVELFPCLRKFGIRFYAYNPLAGGMLTGKHADIGAEATSTRFDKSNEMYRSRYWKPAMFESLQTIKAACDACGVSMAAASLRWLVHHSALRGTTLQTWCRACRPCDLHAACWVVQVRTTTASLLARRA
jgi:aflatoxin B1 aldehyde reductase